MKLHNILNKFKLQRSDFSFRKPISLFSMAAIISLLNLVCYNIPFLQFAIEHSNGSFLSRTWLIISLVLALLILNFFAIYLLLFLTRKVGKVLQAILLIINSVATYFVITYQVLMDEGMMGNVFNTRYSEASGFFSWKLFAFIVFLGILPATLLIIKPIKYGTWKKMAINCGTSLLLSLVIVATNIGQTLFFSQYDTELGGLVMPWSYIVNTCRMYSSKNAKEVKEIPLPDATITDSTKTAVVLVIGESARKANFQLYGYNRATNPYLSKQKDLRVLQAESCDTYTTAGVKAIVEPEESDDLYEILPNYAFRTGVDVSWRTYNWGEPPVHIDEYLTDQDLAKIYPDVDAKYDEILFTGLKQRIEQSKQSKVLIILHTSTNHGPDYPKKYPKEFEHFKPVFTNVEEAHEDDAKLYNAYDNSVLYADYLVSNLIDTLRTMSDWQTAMLYVSDHGESLGENNVYMHGLPKKIAPKVQYEIPFLVWMSSDFREMKSIVNTEEASEDQLPTPIDQHYVFHSILNLLSIDSPAYKKKFDLFKR